MEVRFKCLVFAYAIALLFGKAAAVPPCSSNLTQSQIYCDGPLLKTVQLAEPKLYHDSKTFVDMHLKNNPDMVLQAFTNLTRYQNYTRDQLKQFVDEYFGGPGLELDKWTPNDTVSNPKFLQQVKDQELKTFGKELCNIWRDLGRKIKKDVKDNPQRYSLIYLPNPFIVPGGRFREIYYWDSYWVVKGLLTCEMHTTIKGMLENLMTFVDKYGKIPNGGRIYYTERSQPPLLIPMVQLYFDATKDRQFITKYISTLEKEYMFWMKERNINVTASSGETHTMNRYATPLTMPRPESFKEDFGAAQNLSVEAAETLYSNLGSGAETGWDFSSRWFQHEDPASLLADTVVRDIIPVDLNSILCWNEQLLASFYDLIGNKNKAAEFRQFFEERRESIEKLLWNSSHGAWFDYHIKPKRQREKFYPSDVFPMYVGCYPNATNTDYGEKIRSYLQTSGALNFTTGIPTSLDNTGQQWDLPNGWPPLQEIVVTALDNSGDQKGHQMALDVVKKWVHSNWKGWKRTGRMFEKYSVTAVGSRGGGGEYDVQEGFGWTNGVILDFLARYGNEFTLDEYIDTCDARTCGAETMATFNVIYFACLVFYHLILKL